jgi:uncharacterized protein (DUF1015 family)
MATILPFRAIRPHPFYADQLVFDNSKNIVVMGNGKTEEKLPPLKDLLEGPARQRPEVAQEKAFRDIRSNLQRLLMEDKLILEERSGLYVYEIIQKTYRQTGIWALTSLADYRDGSILTHENTFDENVSRQRNYRENIGLEGSPVLLTYTPNITINRIIATVRETRPTMLLGTQYTLHKLWKIEAQKNIDQLIFAFSKIGNTYLSDGHHRMESASAKAGTARVYDTISSLYMCTDQVRIEDYNRVVIPDQPVSQSCFFKHLEKYFELTACAGNIPVRPAEAHCIGMLFNGKWLRLRLKNDQLESNGSEPVFDVDILQKWVFEPFFGIAEPKNDTRIKYTGGERTLEEIANLVYENPSAVAFTICPMDIKELMRVADAGKVLPPKSTWIVPKVPYGILINRHK